jgi:hypothetical protein
MKFPERKSSFDLTRSGKLVPLKWVIPVALQLEVDALQPI